MPDPIAVAAGLGASFAAASVLLATWEIRRARESVSSSYRLGNETALVAELGIEPNELRRFEVWLSADDGDDPVPLTSAAILRLPWRSTKSWNDPNSPNESGSRRSPHHPVALSIEPHCAASFASGFRVT
jgi:hypothetical protein